MFGLSPPFLVIIGLLILARIGLGLYIWWSFRRLKKRIKTLEEKS